MPGHFIVIDGPDGAGTTLHTQLLAERLQREGHDVLTTAEPTEGPIGVWIRNILRGQVTLPSSSLQMLFTADRAWHVDTVIQPALRKGQTVITDRYSASTLAYGTALGLPEHWLRAVNDEYPAPDAQLFLLPPIAVCLERLGRRTQHDILEGKELQEKIHDAYRSLAQRDSSILVLDSAGEKAAVADRIYAAVIERISR